MLQLNNKNAGLDLFVLYLNHHKTKIKKGASPHGKYKTRYRLLLIKYAEKFGITKAAIKYKTNRQYLYRWR